MKDSNNTNLPCDFQTPATDGAALVRHLWDHIDMNYPLYQRFVFLVQSYLKITKDLIKDAFQAGVFMGPKPPKPLQWIFRNNSHGYPCDEVKYGIFEAWKTISKFKDLRTSIYPTPHIYSKEELEGLGFTEDLFLTTLSQISKFAAWAYGLPIDPYVQTLIQGVPAPNDTITTGQMALTYDDMADNKTQRSPIMIIIDNSLSMGEDNVLERLKMGLKTLSDEIAKSNELRESVELYVATCGGGPRVIAGFNLIERQKTALDNLNLIPFGSCKMAETIEMSLDDFHKRQELWASNAITIRSPYLLILSNGNKLKGDMQHVIHRLRTDFQYAKIFALGVSKNANLDALRAIDPNAILLDDLTGLFKDAFNSLERISFANEGGGRANFIGRHTFANE